MFFCDSCGKKNDWPSSMSKSRGMCEVCGKVKVCSDVPSRYLNPPIVKIKRLKR